MKKTFICIECPKGCGLHVEINEDQVLEISGNECPLGEKYALSESINPTRILTSTVLTEGMPLKMVPVKTDKPIPKGSIFKAIEEVKKARITRPLRVGDIVVENIADSGANLIATRECLSDSPS